MSLKNKNRLKIFMVIFLAVFSGILSSPKPTKIAFIDDLVSKTKINLGLDLQGGVHLVYQADMSQVEKGKEMEALSGVQDVIERRVNAFGVSEPVVQPSRAGDEYRIIVELAGIKDIEEAKKQIKETPLLEFKEEKDGGGELTPEEEADIDAQVEGIKKMREEKRVEAVNLLAEVKKGADFAQLAKEKSDDPGSAEEGGDLGFFKKGEMVKEFEEAAFSENLKVGEIYPEIVESDFGFHIIKKTDERGEGEDKEIRASHILIKAEKPERVKEILIQQAQQPQFENTGLSGKDLERAQLIFDNQTGQPVVSLKFNAEGTQKFKEITERNVGKRVAIFLDGAIISAPVVNEVIRNGEAVISGDFSITEAKQLAQRLNAGALPVPIKLVGQQTIEASLGKESLEKSLKAGIWGLAAVSGFLVLYYRLAGLVAVIALLIYTALFVSLIKLSSLSQNFTITLTLAGIAGIILSIGMAVDANILIFERMKEELKRGRQLKAAIRESFRRAWPSIRDGNYSTILTSLILITFGSGFVKGFAITLILGVLLSMFTAIVITKILINAFSLSWFEKRKGLFLVRVPNLDENKSGENKTKN